MGDEDVLIAFDEGQRMHEYSVEEQLIETLHILAKQNDTPYVIVAGSALEDLLELVLRESMGDLSNPSYSNIFDGLLSTFGAKIGIAYAFKIIGDDLINDFIAINKVRNEFAHARGPIQFGSSNPKLEKAFKKFSGWTNSSDQRALFDERLKACMQALNSQVESAIFIQAWADVP
ncbi:hypothetical protein RZS28_02890 [Methylocapsa polymorpha]|uniref:Uncharacterized protein n=1 Tax=Methylocapsa polymorpha TaxID=3080828 RepID=A0ABZ0HTM4_9HYPH|nr:hypothetical protein RZS28_02890 [Methylocapsa sp. RX1]